MIDHNSTIDLDAYWRALRQWDNEWVGATVFKKKPRLVIRPDNWAPFLLSGRGSPTPIFVIADTIYLSTTLMGGWSLYGNSLDLPTYAHEAFHVQQFAERGWWWLARQYIRGMFMSWSSKRILWDHNVIPMEIEASLIEARIRKWWSP